MAVAAIVALIHDLVITVGIYALSGLRGHAGDGDRLPDHPGLLALRHGRRLRQGPGEHHRTSRTSRMTYAEAANLAVNQTLVRSINTSIVALLPVGAILVRRRGLLGAGTAEGPRARPVRRHGGRRVLVDLHRDAAAGRAEDARARRPGAREAGQDPARVTTPTATPTVPAVADDCRSRSTPTPPWRTPPRDDGRATPVTPDGSRPQPAPRRPAAAASSQARGPVAPAAASAKGPAGVASPSRSAARSDRPGTPTVDRAASGSWSATSPTSRSRGSCSRTSRRCSPTATAFAAVVDGAGRRRPRRVRSTSVVDKVVGIEARGFILARAGRAATAASASSRCARRASCRAPTLTRVLRPGVRRGRRSRCTSDALPPGRAGAARRRRARHRRHRRSRPLGWSSAAERHVHAASRC